MTSRLARPRTKPKERVYQGPGDTACPDKVLTETLEAVARQGTIKNPKSGSSERTHKLSVAFNDNVQWW